MALRVYNTLSRTKESFQTVAPGKVGMYVCGPTVYSKSHIGHMVGPVIFDTVKRYLAYLGYEVSWVVNITDVDDKLIVQAQKDGTTVKALAEQVTADYLDCLKALNVTGVDHMPRATEHIDDIIDMNQGLIDKGFAYASGGDVYFDVSKADAYGKLSHRDPEELQAGARIEPSTLKRNPGDFALWKASKPGEPSWESPWGPGRPGWHIECSAMSLKLLGRHFDIHGGGLDLVFPHHENELVQSESFTGGPFASYWMHNGLLTREGRKISKSDPDTIVLMSDLLDEYEPDVIRMLLLSSHYRRPIDYGPTRLAEISRSLQTFHRAFERFEELTGERFDALEAPTRRHDQEGDASPELTELRQGFLDAMDDDFNTGGAVGELFEIVHVLNRTAAGLSPDSPPQELTQYREGMVALKELSNLLGLFARLPDKSQVGGDALTGDLMSLLIELRARLRKEKHYALADEVRNRLAGLGVVLEDGADGTRWRVEAKR
ncbi:cysteine--tRNA ligase [Planctomyces sp. SH-PL62]|uniref:cysteine--tRNA ligase n=1 Tax=Planctomyces sp. SH-PL62 TaxID=1636152 RepID=UPI00078B37F3|nr:cysteine--tRNA ligase [Planctomyces sp. SH-PL62]AMV38619.1 Cysteine--tRNA ligase [Planctomyces sp. SH-PL62]